MTYHPSLRVLLALLVVLALARWVSPLAAIGLTALIAFSGLREYLSLADLRPEDRWAMLAAYLAIPLQFYLVAIDWYGFFIVAVPVYVFLLIPFLVVLGGGEARGCVFSVGGIDFGLFLFVYCLGHFAYLTRFTLSLALFLVLGVALVDLIERAARRTGGGAPLSYAAAVLPVFLVVAVLGGRAGLALPHQIGLALILPLVVLMGNFTLRAVETDLGIDPEQIEPGRGRIIDGLRSQLFAAPVVFHYLRYFTDIL